MKARSRKTNDGGKKRGERREVCGGGAERKKWVEERESRIVAGFVNKIWVQILKKA